MVNLTINGKSVSVKEGTTILEAAKTIGETIPTLCLLYTSPSPRDGLLSRMPSSA